MQVSQAFLAILPWSILTTSCPNHLSLYSCRVVLASFTFEGNLYRINEWIWNAVESIQLYVERGWIDLNILGTNKK